MSDESKQGPDVILGSYVYVKQGIIDPAEVEARYNVDIYHESSCGKCKNRPNRPNELCDGCPAYFGKYIFNKTKYLRHTGEAYDALPPADFGHVRSWLEESPRYDDLTVRNVRDIKKLRWPLKFTGKLFGPDEYDDRGNPRADQEKLVADWLEHKIGIIRAPPRSGKSILATYLTCHLGVRTVIIADKYKLLKQFYDTFMGNPGKGVKAMTNSPELERRVGKGRVVCLVTKTSQMRRFSKEGPEAWPQVLLLNYQKMIHKPGRVFQWLNENYSFMAVDEVHGAGADKFAKILFLADMPYRLGLSATPDRKDQLNRKTDFTVGPVVASSSSISLAPTVQAKLVQTLPDLNYKVWTYATQWARNSSARNDEIVREVFLDLAAGHEVIIVPVHTRAQQRYLCDQINQRIKHWRRTHEEWRDVPYPLAVEFNATSKQDAVIDRVDDGRPCVLVAIQSMIKQGVDMRRPSMIYLLEPLSANRQVGAPVFEQLSYRVATPSADKPMYPVVKIWVDQIGMFRGALTGLFWQEIVPNSHRTADSPPKYKLDRDAYAVLSSLRGGRSRSYSSGQSRKRAAVGGWL